MKKYLNFTLLLFLLLICSSCEQSKIITDEVIVSKVWDYEEPILLVYDCLGGDGTVMPVFGYWSAPGDATLVGQFFPDMKNDDYYTSLKEAGINLLMQHNDDASKFYDDLEKTLNYCDKYEIGLFVNDSRLINDGSLVCSSKDLETGLKDYVERHKSFAGLYIKDEPTKVDSDVSCNSALKAFYSASNLLGYNIQAYVNMLPYEVNRFKPNALEKYPEALSVTYGETGCPVVSYDIYPLEKDNGMNYERFYTNLTLVRQYALENNVTYAPFVQVSVSGDAKKATEGELCWEVNTYLAFGAKSIYYFPINSPISFYNYIESGESDIVAPYDYLGNKTELYYYMKEANRQVLAVDEYLMLATNHGVVTHGNVNGMNYLLNDEVLSTESFREMVSVKGDACIIGCFDYYGKTLLYVVNDNMYKCSTNTIEFDNRYEFDVIQRGVKASAKGKKVNLSLAEGEAALIILK